MTKQNPPTDTEIEHWEAFINQFVPGDRRRRWSTLARMGYQHWSDLPLADFIGYETKGRDVVIQDAREVDLSSCIASFGVSPSHLCLVLNTGRGGNAGSKALPLSECLSGDLPLEALISILPGKLALLLDHEDNISLCAVTQTKQSGHGTNRSTR